MIGRVALAVCILGGVAACGDDEPPPRDTGPPDAVIDAPMDTSPPIPTVAPAAPPVLTPCPDGWREIAGDGDGPAHCAPFPGDAPEDCPADEAHFPGGAGCELVGDPCPADGFPPDLPSTDVYFVRAGAPAGGDGTRTAPFVEVADALAAVPAGSTIAVAPGTYGPIRITESVSIIGACTDVIFSSTELLATIEVTVPDVSIRNVRVTGSPNGISVRGGTLDARGLILDDLEQTALSALRGGITGSRLKIFDVADTGISFATSSTGALDHVAVIDAGNDSVRTTGSTATITDGSIVRSTDGQLYFGTGSGSALFERVAFSGAGTLIAINETDIELRDVVLEGPPEGFPTLPGAIAAFEVGTLAMNRVRIDRARSLGAAVADPGSVLALTDVMIRDTMGSSGEATGHGIELGTAAEGTLERVWVESSLGIGILAATDARFDARDVTVVDTQPDGSGVLGRALQVQMGASFVGTRVEIHGSHEVAIVAATTGTTVELSNLLVTDTRARTCAICESAGIGIGSYLGAAISVEQFSIQDNALAGVQIANDGSVDLLNGEIAMNPVGVNIQVPGYDVDRLTGGVYFRENGTNLDSSELPIPSAAVMR